MHPNTTKLLLEVLENQVRQTKRAYDDGVAGVTYDDMAASARRLLEMRVAYERASGRKVTTKVSKRSIASLLR